MRVPAPAEALRVARALIGISQRVAAERSRILPKTLGAAESGKTTALDTNLALVDFYKSAGIVFFGECVIGDKITCGGAAWLSPESPSAVKNDEVSFHFEVNEISFKAARALLGKEQADIAASTDLGLDAIKKLELRTNDGASYHALRRWYEDQGVEFLGWGDISSQRYYGVGVRRTTKP